MVWGRRESNPHALRHVILSHACLPIPALPRSMQRDYKPLNYERQQIRYNVAGESITAVSEANLSRIINVDGVGKQRRRYTKEVVLAIRELMQQGGVNDQTKDLAAFISIRLQAIFDTIERTVAPWEKRDYWVKADRFRMEWAWSGKYADDMQQALINDDWGTVAQIAANTAEKLNKVEVSKRHRLGEPWHGSWQALINQVES
jgi:hypothetical protein